MGWLRGRRQPQRGSQGQPGEPKTGEPIAGSVSPYAAGLIEGQRNTWEERLRIPEPGALNIVAEAIPGGTGADGRSDDEVQITARDELNISQSAVGRAGRGAAGAGGRHDSSILISGSGFNISQSAIGSGARVTICRDEVVTSTDADRGGADFEVG